MSVVSPGLTNIANSFDWSDDSDFDYDDVPAQPVSKAVGAVLAAISSGGIIGGGGDGYGFSSDEEAGLDAARDESHKALPGALLPKAPSVRGPKAASLHPGHRPEAGADTTGPEACAGCATVTADGDFDLDDGNWYCLACWEAHAEDAAYDHGAQVQPSRSFQDPTAGERRHVDTIPPDIAHRLILAMYPDPDAYDHDDHLGIEEDLKMAELLAAKEAANPIPSLGRRGTMSTLPTQSKVGEKYQSLAESVLEAGWLEKRGGGTSRLGNKRYKKRWFELVRTTTGVFLTYQCEPGDGVLKGAIEMHSVWLQNDPARALSLHEVSDKSTKRTFHLKALSLPEKNGWLRALNTELIKPQAEKDIIKAKSIPDVAGWLTVTTIQPPKRGAARLQWCELWVARGQLMMFDTATQSEPACLIKCGDAAVVSDTAEEVNAFSVMLGPVEYRCDQQCSSKAKWIDALVPLTTIGILMEKNSGRKLNVLRDTDQGPPGSTFV